MSRLPFIAGNWKINKNPEELKLLLKQSLGNYHQWIKLKLVLQLQLLI